MRSHIIALIRYARDHKFCPAEKSAAESIPERKATTKKETYSRDEFAALLRAVPLEWLPAIILGGFCGIRPEELCPNSKSHKQPLQWSDFLWHKEAIRIPEDTAKARSGEGRVRWVPIGKTALAWLMPWRNATGPCTPRMKMSNQTSKWAKLAGIRWKFDALRHSYASYRLAVTGDISRLSEEMGNSVKLIRRHYLDVKRIDEGVEYFDLTPEKVGRTDLQKVTAVA